MNTESLKNIKEFIQDFKINTLGIVNRDFYINVLERMKHDPKYNLTEELTLQIEKVIKERKSIEDIQKDIVEPLEEYYEEAKEQVEQVLENEEPATELEENRDISNSDSMEEEKFSDINYKQYLTDFLVSVGFIKLENNLEDKNYQIAFSLQNMNMVDNDGRNVFPSQINKEKVVNYVLGFNFFSGYYFSSSRMF